MLRASAFVTNGWRASVCARRNVYEKNVALGFEKGTCRDTCQYAIFSYKLYEYVIVVLEKLHTLF